MRRRISGSVLVNVDVEDILDELSDDNLLDAVKDRGLSVEKPVSSEDALWSWECVERELRSMVTKDRLHLEVMLLRLRTLAGIIEPKALALTKELIVAAPSGNAPAA